MPGKLGGVLTSPQAAPSGLQMTPGTEKSGMPGSPDFILITFFPFFLTADLPVLMLVA